MHASPSSVHSLDDNQTIRSNHTAVTVADVADAERYEEQRHACAECGHALGGTYWHCAGEQFCETCWGRLHQPLVLERLPSGSFAWLRPAS